MKRQKFITTISYRHLLSGVLLLIQVSICSGLFAQNQRISTFIDTLKKHEAEEETIQVDTIDPQFNITLNIRAFVVNSKDGNTHLTVQTMQEGLDWANLYFKEIGIQFRYLIIDTVPEYEYAYITDPDSTAEIELKYARPDYINLFLVDSIKLDNQSVRGYSSFPGDTLHSSIFLVKDHAGDKTLTQKLGNFFGLLDTDERIGGSEHVNEDNCKTSGDFLCDTYADPNINGKVDSDCRYHGDLRDAYGDFYVPSVANLMSNAPDNCKCVFSMGQYRRMLYYYQKFRSGLK